MKIIISFYLQYSSSTFFFLLPFFGVDFSTLISEATDEPSKYTQLFPKNIWVPTTCKALC